jgi:hypothetical protein
MSRPGKPSQSPGVQPPLKVRPVSLLRCLTTAIARVCPPLIESPASSSQQPPWGNKVHVGKEAVEPQCESAFSPPPVYIIRRPEARAGMICPRLPARPC